MPGPALAAGDISETKGYSSPSGQVGQGTCVHCGEEIHSFFKLSQMKMELSATIRLAHAGAGPRPLGRLQAPVFRICMQLWGLLQMWQTPFKHKTVFKVLVKEIGDYNRTQSEDFFFNWKWQKKKIKDKCCTHVQDESSDGCKDSEGQRANHAPYRSNHPQW